MNYQEADRQVDELVQQGRFKEAHMLLEKMRAEFSEHTYEITDYIVYIYLLWDRPNDAIRELLHALERGHFYPVDQAFMKDRLGHLPEYATLKSRSLQLQKIFQRESRSKWEIFAPAPPLRNHALYLSCYMEMDRISTRSKPTGRHILLWNWDIWFYTFKLPVS